MNLKRHARTFTDSLRVLYGCEAHFAIKILATPVIIGIAALITVINVLDRE